MASLAKIMPAFGTKLNADIAVLELDEAYAVHFVNQIKPRYSLLLNVMRDQLDRFGEIDTTAKLLSNVAAATEGTVVLNREDSRICALAKVVPSGTCVRYFGLDDAVKSMFPTDDDLHNTAEKSENCKDTAESKANNLPKADVVLSKVGDHEAEFILDGKSKTTSVKLDGAYNIFNAAAAATVVRAILADATKQNSALQKFDDDALMEAISHVTPAFGRGEVIEVNGAPVELVLSLIHI